jgi:hypothetical protein
MYAQGAEPFNCVGDMVSLPCLADWISTPEDICGAIFNKVRALEMGITSLVKTSRLYLVPSSCALVIADDS